MENVFSFLKMNQKKIKNNDRKAANYKDTLRLAVFYLQRRMDLLNCNYGKMFKGGNIVMFYLILAIISSVLISTCMCASSY